MADFRIAAAQVASLPGDLVANVATHAAAIEAAAREGVAVLVFPELSLTGYEPDLAASLAIEPTDERLGPLGALARRHGMDVVVGAPLVGASGRPKLGAIVLGADGSTGTYAKMHLGGVEPSHFDPGEAPRLLETRGVRIGLAICADASEASHPAGYARAGASVYAAGVFLNAEWDATDRPRLAGYARGLGLLVLLANHGASPGAHRSVGRSAAWGPDGARLAEADGTRPSLVIATGRAGAWSGRSVAIG